MIKIFADSVSNLFPDIIKSKKLDIKVLKVHLQIDNVTYDLYEENFDVKKFNKIYYDALEQKKKFILL